jgi:hypothetical protein
VRVAEQNMHALARAPSSTHGASHMTNLDCRRAKHLHSSNSRAGWPIAIFSRLGAEFLNISLFSFGIILHFVFAAGNYLNISLLSK